MVDQLTELMAPVWDGSGELGDEPVRQVGGLGQIMVSESRWVDLCAGEYICIGRKQEESEADFSREAYAQLTTPPMLKTLDWTRSRVRREHLISMGVPVNLDEVSWLCGPVMYLRRRHCTAVQAVNDDGGTRSAAR